MNRPSRLICCAKATVTILLTAALLTAHPVRAQEEVAYVGPEIVKSWMDENKAFTVLDVRTPAEFVFVGHPVGAVNIPLMFWNPESEWSANEDFMEEVGECLDKNATIITLCRSGGRARKAAEMLKKFGYESVFVFTDGFEGPIDEKGMRTRAGWKVNGLPYTYEGEPYRPVNPAADEEKEQGAFKDPES